MNDWILLLGANSDMAKATARAFAREGYNVALASRNVAELERLAGDLQIRFGVESKALYFDAADTGSHAAFVEESGIEPEGVIAAFGVMYDQEEAQKEFALAKTMIEVNYLGAVSILERYAALFESRRRGFIIGISSVAGDRGRKTNYLYGSSKAAFSAYLSGLRNRLYGSGVHVMTVKPGFVATKMTRHLDLSPNLTASPETVAEAIVAALKRQKDVLYTKGIWALIMLIIKHIPEKIFKRLSI